MDVISLRLRPIQPSHAARAIGRFLAQRSGEGEDDAAQGLSADVYEQLKGMKAALQVVGKAKKSRSRFSSSSASASSSAEAALPLAAADEGEASASSGKRRRL